MRICITCLGDNLKSPIDPRFGRAQFLLLLDENGKLKDTIKNPGLGARGGAGIAAAQELANRKVDILITGNIGPNAFRVLNISNIKIFLAAPRTSVKDAFQMWKDNKLDKVKKPSVSGHFGMGPRGGRAGPRRGGGPGGGPQNR